MREISKTLNLHSQKPISVLLSAQASNPEPTVSKAVAAKSEAGEVSSSSPAVANTSQLESKVS